MVSYIHMFGSVPGQVWGQGCSGRGDSRRQQVASGAQLLHLPPPPPPPPRLAAMSHIPGINKESYVTAGAKWWEEVRRAARARGGEGGRGGTGGG
eukprot:SAG31_NODE_24768_length_474_cov_1.053333_1_plen_94_part_10